ncbi:S24/S26 family peptidase [candidate division KSB1 bacterium]|nr:S24/S26 family peptidase [candidate division KSB1 bacterium]
MRTLTLKNHQVHGIAKDALLKNGTLQLKVFGNSMSPFIRNGDIVRISSLNNKNPHRGSIIFYRLKNRLYMHRIVKKSLINNNPVVFTRGDSTFAEIHQVPVDFIIGFVSHLYKNNKLIPVNSFFNRKIALSWYYLLPLRQLLTTGQKGLKLIRGYAKSLILRSHH